MSHELGNDYQSFHQELISELLERFKTQPPFNALHDSAAATTKDDILFIRRLEALTRDPNTSEQGYPLGQWVITAISVRYPHLMALVPRDLLWFFGGDCMHHLKKEEIYKFQQLAEVFYTQDSETDQLRSYEALRSTILR